MEYPVHKGILKPVEIKGLRSQYIIIAGVGVIVGLVISLALSVIAGVFIMAGSLIGSVYMNGKYGVNGLAEKRAGRSHVRYILNNSRVLDLVKMKGDEVH